MVTSKNELVENELKRGQTAQTQRALLEYNDKKIVRSDNAFKRHADGQKLYLKWRLKMMDDKEVSAIIGIGASGLRMLKKRLEDSTKVYTSKDLPKDFALSLEKHHLDLVQESIELNKEMNEEFTGTIMPNYEVAIGKEDKNFLTQTIFELLNLDKSASLEKIALMVHKKVGFDLYEMFNNAKVQGMKWGGDRRALPWLARAESLGNAIRPYMMEIIEKYNSLHSESVTNVAKDYEDRLKLIVQYYILKHPDDLMELMTFINTKQLPMEELKETLGLSKT